MLHYRDTLFALAFYAGFVILLMVLPRWLEPAADGMSAASVDGYNTSAAFFTALTWSVLGIAFFATIHRNRPPVASQPASTDLTTDPTAPGFLGRSKVQWIEMLAIGGVFFAAYFPLFLARHAPYGEDQYFLAALHRMDGGLVPYRDFSFLYGPLMIYPAWAWSQLFGFSLVSYFSYLATLEGLQFAILLGVLQGVIPNRRYRYAALLILLPFLLDTLMGPSWNGMRRLLAVFAVLLASARPYERPAQVWTAVLIGLHLAYSHEYAAGGLLAVLGMYGLSFVRGEGWRAVRAAGSLVLGSVIVWSIVSWSLLGRDFGAYIEHAREVVAQMSTGLANFTFYWTANSLALFGLLAIACIAIGRGILRERTRAFGPGDRLLICGVLNALVILKSGLSRCDHWHLGAAFLVLLFAFLLPLRRAILFTTPGESRVGLALAAAASLTYLVGIAPTGSLYAAGYVNGLKDTAAQRVPEPASGPTRTVCLEFERSSPRPHFVSLARFLASEALANRPVFFFSRAWHLGPFLGVYPTGYALDDQMYSEDQQPSTEFLRAHPDALVVLAREDYERLFALTETTISSIEYWKNLSATKQIGRWLATPHYDAKPLEEQLKDREQDEVIGAYIRSHYSLLDDFGDYLVLH